MGLARLYDPRKAHDYYLRTRKLKGGRTKAQTQPVPRSQGLASQITQRQHAMAKAQEEHFSKWLKNAPDKALSQEIKNIQIEQKGTPVGKTMLELVKQELVRRKGQAATQKQIKTSGTKSLPKTVKENLAAKRKAEIAAQEAKQKARTQVAQEVASIQKELTSLEAKLKEKIAAEKKVQDRAAASAAKAAQPPTAADKAQAARDAKKYRDTHQQQLKTKASQATGTTSGGSSSTSSSTTAPGDTIDTLKAKIANAQERLKVAVGKQQILA